MIEETFSQLVIENEKLYKRISLIEACLKIATQALESLDSGAMANNVPSNHINIVEAQNNAIIRQAIEKIRQLRKMNRNLG